MLEMMTDMVNVYKIYKYGGFMTRKLSYNDISFTFLSIRWVLSRNLALYCYFFSLIVWHVICCEKIDRQNHAYVRKLSSGTWQHSKMLPVITPWVIEVCVWAEHCYASVTNAQLAGLPPGLTRICAACTCVC